MRGYMGLDCGLTRIKAVVFDETGQCLCASQRDTPLGGTDIDAQELWHRACEVMCEAAQAAPCPIESVGLSGHGNGLYALDGDGEPVIACSSMFADSQPVTERFIASGSYARFCELARQSAWSGQPVQILRWLRAERPETYARIRHVLMCKDYIRYRLTDTLMTDVTDASASTLWTRQGGVRDRELFDLLEIPEARDWTPEALDSHMPGGCVTHRAAAETGLNEGTPVAIGTFDVAACALGAGVTEPGLCSVTAGTWGVAAAVTHEATDLRPLTQECALDSAGGRLAVVSAPTSCVNLDWFVTHIGPELDYAEANRVASGFAPGDVSALYLPYLYRDMARAVVPGAFVGLSPSDTWRELLRAVYEGVAFAHRTQLDRLRVSGVRCELARLSGGAANAELWCQLFADVLGLPITTLQEKQAGALGAAILAAVCAGAYSSKAEATKRMVRPDRVFMPAAGDPYGRKYERFQTTVEKIAQVF